MNKSKKCGCTNKLCNCDDLECMNYSCDDKCNCIYSQELKKLLFEDDHYYFNDEKIEKTNH